MKKYIILSILLIIGIIFNINKSYAIDPDCLQMLMGNDGATVSNPDSVMVDTCINSPSFGQWYVKKGIYIMFSNYPFAESPIQVNIKKYWYNIDTNLPLLREKMQYINNKYGDFSIVRKMSNEQVHIEQKDFVIEFENYTNWANIYPDLIDSTTNLIKDLWFDPPINLDVKEDVEYKIISYDLNHIKISCNGLNINNIKISNIFGDIIDSEYLLSGNFIDIPISYLSTGVYFLLIDNIKPIKFIKY